jgi:hypothetical protein
MSLKIESVKTSGEFVWNNDEIRFKSPLKACFLSGNFAGISKVFLISLKTPQNFRHQFHENTVLTVKIFIRFVKLSARYWNQKSVKWSKGRSHLVRSPLCKIMYMTLIVFSQCAEEFEAMCSNRKKFRGGIASHRCPLMK